MDTREVVSKYFEYVNSGRWDDYLTLFDDHVVMDEQLMGHMEGIAEVAKGIEGLRHQPSFRNQPLEIIVEGDKSMAIWRITADLPNGAKLDGKGVNFFVVKNGKIVKFSNYHDTVPFKAVMGG